MKRITDRTFVYVPSYATSIGKTIAREKRRLAKLAELQAKFPATVRQIRKDAK